MTVYKLCTCLILFAINVNTVSCSAKKTWLFWNLKMFHVITNPIDGTVEWFGIGTPRYICRELQPELIIPPPPHSFYRLMARSSPKHFIFSNTQTLCQPGYMLKWWILIWEEGDYGKGCRGLRVLPHGLVEN